MRKKFRINCLSMALGLLTLMLLVNAARAQDGISAEQARLAEIGEGIFQEKCSACHTVGGGNLPMGPDLAGVLDRRDPEWVKRFIREPGKVIASGDPTAQQLLEQYKMQMPAIKVTDQELAALMAFLAHPEEAAHEAGEATAPRAPATPVEGDVAQGKALYVGTEQFANGGAPCLACHGIAGAGLGLAAGASYGADLTSFYEDYGEEGVVSILETLPFPSMEPIYADHPLTAAEQADLTAFFASVGGAQPAAVGGSFVIQALGAMLALVIILYIGGHWRLRGVRRPLVKKQRQPSSKGDMR